MNTRPLIGLGLLLVPLITGTLPAAERLQAGITDFQAVNRLAQDLYQALDAKSRQLLAPDLALSGDTGAPTLRAEGSPAKVTLNPACIALIDRLSRAKAIDASTPGYFQAYLGQLAEAPADKSVPELPPAAGVDLDSVETVNLQVGYFNQIAAGLVALERSHVALGHYGASGAMVGGTPKQWQQAVLKGARNALECGVAVDGMIVLFEGFETMPARPEWSYRFMPADAKVSKIRKELLRLEKNFFLAGN